MNETSNSFESVLEGIIRRVMREEIRAVIGTGIQKSTEGTVKPYLTVKEAATASGLGASTIRLYIRKRLLRAQQVGRRVLVKRNDLEKFLETSPIEAKIDE